MSLLNNKISSEAIANNGVVSAPDKLTGNAQQNKMVFDRLIREIVAAMFNSLIDKLVAGTGAAEIGAAAPAGVEGTTIQEVINNLQAKNDQSGSQQDTINQSVQQQLDNRYTKDQTDLKLAAKFDSTSAQKLIKNVTFEESTGTFTFTAFDGTTIVIDTLFEKLPAKIYLEGDQLVVEQIDGSKQYADLSSFIDEYTFTDSGTVEAVDAGGRKYSFSVKDGSITLAKLDPDVSTTIEGYATRAEAAQTAAQASAGQASTSATTAINNATAAGQSASDADSSQQAAHRSETAASGYKNQAQSAATTAAGKATEAKSWAVGGTGTRPGEDANNAKYWADQARESAGGDYVTNTVFNEHVDSDKHVVVLERDASNFTVSRARLSGKQVILNDVSERGQYPVDIYEDIDDMGMVMGEVIVGFSPKTLKRYLYSAPDAEGAPGIPYKWGEKAINLVDVLIVTASKHGEIYKADATDSQIRNFSNGGGYVEMRYTTETGEDRTYHYEGYVTGKGAIFRRSWQDAANYNTPMRTTIIVDYAGNITVDTTEDEGAEIYGNVVKATASGTEVHINDISPLRHTVTAKLRGANFIPYPFKSNPVKDSNLTITPMPDGSIMLDSGGHVVARNYEFDMFSSETTYPAGIVPGEEYILSTPFSGKVTGHGIEVRCDYFDGGGAKAKIHFFLPQTEKVGTIPASAVGLKFYVFVYKQTIVDHVVLKPRFASKADFTGRTITVADAEGNNAVTYTADADGVVTFPSVKNAMVVTADTEVDVTYNHDNRQNSGVSNVNMTAAGWQDGVYRIENPLITGVSTQEIAPAPTITAEQLSALQGANLVGMEQGNGFCTIKAFGTVPTVDVPVILTVRRD